MAATLMLPTTLGALAALVDEYPLHCEHIVVSDRVEAIAIVGDVPVGRRLFQVQALVVLPGDGARNLGLSPVSEGLEVAFQP
jgi:hypothetical protein